MTTHAPRPRGRTWTGARTGLLRGKRPALLAGTVTTMLAGLMLASPAAAGDWGWGAAFRIGGLHFRIGHSPHHAGHHDHYYYQTRTPIRSHHRCTDRCFVRSRTYYHHRTCPVVRGYLGRHGYDYVDVFQRYAPFPRLSYPPYRYGPYRNYGRYGDYGRRYDRDRRAYERDRRRWERQRREYERDRRRERRYRERHRHPRYDDDWRYRRHRYDD